MLWEVEMEGSNVSREGNETWEVEMEGSNVSREGNETHPLSLVLTQHQVLIVHISGIVASSTSLIVSGLVLVTFWMNRKKFWLQPLGERLALYLTISDVIYGVCIILNYWLMLSYQGNPPANLCAISGYVTYSTVLYPLCFLVYYAINACLTVVVEVKLHLGKYDCKLLLPVFFLPPATNSIFLFIDLYGNSGTWCGHDMEKPYADITSTLLGAAMTLVFFINLTCYLSVACKIVSTMQKMKNQTVGNPSVKTSETNPINKYRRTLRTMVVYMVVYFIQYGMVHVYYIENLFNRQSFIVVLGVVVFGNMGGVLNYVAYTAIKRTSTSVGPESVTG